MCFISDHVTKGDFWGYSLRWDNRLNHYPIEAVYVNNLTYFLFLLKYFQFLQFFYD